MAGKTADIGTGTTITFGTSGFNGELLDVGFSMAREEIDVSHMGVAAPGAGKFGNRLWLAGDLSGVEMTAEFHLDTQQSAATNRPLIDAVAETITVTFPKAAGDSTAASWAASGFVTGWDVSLPLEDKCTVSATIRLTGNVTITAAA